MTLLCLAGMFAMMLGSTSKLPWQHFVKSCETAKTNFAITLLWGRPPCLLQQTALRTSCLLCRCNLEFITNKSQEGSQFCRGFGGIGGILRYSVEMADFEEPGDFDDGDDKAAKNDDEWDSDEDFI